MIDTEGVKKLADLARLSVPDEELESLAKDLESIVMFVDVIQSRDVRGEGGTAADVNVFREDVVMPLESAYDLVKAAPAHSDEFVKVPKVIE